MVDRKSKHVMLSYQWNDKADVLQIYDALVAQGFTVWMDVKGGIRENLQASMADGVENAWAVVCFLSQAYQDSQNCQAELTYAREQRKTIVPVFMQSNWKPSGWLGITLAGSLYIKRSSSGLSSLIAAIVERLNTISPNQNVGDVQGNLSLNPVQSSFKGNSSLENQGFAAPGTYGERPCKGRACAKCGICRDWCYTGDLESWQWIRKCKTWQESDWKRYYNDRFYEHFKRRDGATCRGDGNEMNDPVYGHVNHGHYYGISGGYACLCIDNIASNS